MTKVCKRSSPRPSASELHGGDADAGIYLGHDSSGRSSPVSHKTADLVHLSPSSHLLSSTIHSRPGISHHSIIMPTEILIVGATGKQGGKALSNLLESPNASSNLSLRFLTRNPTSASAQKLVARGAKAVKGDLNDTSSLNSALEGVDRAFFVTDALAGEAKEVQQGKNFVNAAQKAGVKHLVFTSVCAADTATIVPHFRSKYEVSSSRSELGIWLTVRLRNTCKRPVSPTPSFVLLPSW